MKILCVFIDHGLLPIFTDRFVQTVHLEFLTHQHCHTIYFKHVLTTLYMSVAGYWLSFVHMQKLGSLTQVLAADFNNDGKTDLYLGGCTLIHLLNVHLESSSITWDGVTTRHTKTPASSQLYMKWDHQQGTRVETISSTYTFQRAFQRRKITLRL